LAEECLDAAGDISGLLLIYSSTGNAKGMEKLAQLAISQGRNNVAFVCYFLLRKLEDCLQLLCETNRIPEAAFFARTYLPSAVPRMVTLWKQDLQTINERAAESLADPIQFENLFPDLGWVRCY
jgi:coatomer subunit beta'